MITTAEFKVRFPEFVTYDDARIQLFIDDATATVNLNCLNSDLMIAYLSAHLLVGGTQTSTGDSLPIKAVASQSVGDVSVSYTTASGGTASIDFYTGTAYGARYLNLKGSCIGSPLIG